MGVEGVPARAHSAAQTADPASQRQRHLPGAAAGAHCASVLAAVRGHRANEGLSSGPGCVRLPCLLGREGKEEDAALPHGMTLAADRTGLSGD